MSDIFETPSQAIKIESLTEVKGDSENYAKAPVHTNNGLYSADIAPLLKHYYNALSMQISYQFTPPAVAWQAGFVLLNGCTLNKADFLNSLQPLINANLAADNGDTVTLADLTGRYLKASLSTIGQNGAESLPNITGLSYVGAFVTGGAGAFKDKTSSTNYGETESNNNFPNVIDFDASRSNSTYKNGAAVNPLHTPAYAYAFCGGYIGNPLSTITYYLLDSVGGYIGEIELPENIGFNESYMTATPPPELNSAYMLVAKNWVKKAP